MNRREALRALSGGAILGAAAGGLAIMAAPSGAASAAGPVDPLLVLIREYREGLAVFNASADDLTDAENDALRDVTWGAAYDLLCENPPAPTSTAGAIEAVRLVFDEERTCGWQPDLSANLLRLALAYFDGRA